MEFEFLPDGVFISYRRSISWMLAKIIHRDLVGKGLDVFIDDKDEGNVSDLGELLSNEIARRKHFLILLQPGTLQRVNDEDDWVRRELEIAMFLKRNIIPIISDDFSFREVELPRRIAAIKDYRGVTVGADNFDVAMRRLVNDFLRDAPNATGTTPLPDAPAPATDIADETMVNRPTSLSQTDLLSNRATTPRKPRQLQSRVDETLNLDDVVKDQLIAYGPPNFTADTCVLLYVAESIQPILLDFEQQESFIIGRNYPGTMYSDVDLSRYFNINKNFSDVQFGVSRSHFEVRVKSNRLLIKDLNSQNGTFVNNSRLLSGQTVQLYDGDAVQAGLMRLQVIFKPGDEARYIYTESLKNDDTRTFFQQLIFALGFRKRNF